MSFYILVLMVAVMAAPSAYGESRKSRRDNRSSVEARRARKLAALRQKRKLSSIQVTQQTAKPQSEIASFRLGLLGGYSLSNDSESRETGEFTSNTDSSTLSLGFNADINPSQYVGFELEGFYGLGGNNSEDLGSVNRVSSRTMIGGLANVKTQLTFHSGSVSIRPRIGAGFGFLSIQDKVEFGDTTEVTTTIQDTRLNGAYGLGGLEVQPTSWLLVGVDYAHGFAVSGTSAIQGEAALGDTELREASFNRIRASLMFRIAPGLMVGTQYVHRAMGFTTPIQTQSTTDASFRNEITQDQFFGVILVEL